MTVYRCPQCQRVLRVDDRGPDDLSPIGPEHDSPCCEEARRKLPSVPHIVMDRVERIDRWESRGQPLEDLDG